MKDEERMKCLSTLEILTKLMIFQEREVTMYDKRRDAICSANNIEDMNTKREENLRRMYQAASKLSDTMHRSFFDYSQNDMEHTVKASVPKAAHKCLYAWRNAFDYLTAVAYRVYMSSPLPPEVDECITESAVFRTEAIKEMNALFRRMKLDEKQVIEMRNRAISEINSEEWYPCW